MNQIQTAPNDYLEHYGVKGMRWGVRKLNRVAKKDAKESARAKMYYGEGAGTRRKLINKTVEARSARSPEYKKAFDKHYSKQNLDAHAAKAISQRRRKDFRNSTGKTARGVKTRLMGPMSPTIAAIAISAAVSHPVVRRTASKYGKMAYSQASSFVKSNF